jgi:hypothetical protein
MLFVTTLISVCIAGGRIFPIRYIALRPFYYELHLPHGLRINNHLSVRSCSLIFYLPQEFSGMLPLFRVATVGRH